MNLNTYQVEEMTKEEMKEINGGLAFFVGLLILAGATFVGALVTSYLSCKTN